MKRAILPTVCFAVLSTVAFEETVFAAQNDTYITENSVITTQYVSISSGFLNLRESPTTTATVSATLIKGTEVTVYSEASGWSKVKVNGNEGYVDSNYLSPTKPVSNSNSTKKTSTKYVNVSSGSLNVRKSGTTSAAVVTTISKGTAVTVYSEANGWTKVAVTGKEGYVSSSYLSSTKPGTNVETPTQVKPKTTTKYVNVSSGSLNVRKSGTTSAAVVTTISKGTAVTVYSEANGWTKIAVAGKEGYVSSSYLSTTKPGASVEEPTQVKPKTTTKYVNVSSGSLNVRKSGTTSAAVVTTISKGTAVTVYSEANGWTKVAVAGKEGYVSSSYLSTTKPGASVEEPTQDKPKTTTKYVNVSSGSLNVRKSGTTSAAVVTTISKGTAVTVYSEANGWTKVAVAGKEGYVSSSYLSSTKPGASVEEPTQDKPKTTTKYVNVSSGSLNMRKDASTDSSIIVKLAKGKEVKVYSESDGWAKVEVFGQIGYVSSRYLISTKPSNIISNPTLPQTTITKYVDVSTSSELNVRDSASMNGTILSTLAKGTEVIVYSESNGWSEIKVNGKEGYVSSKYLSNSSSNSDKTDDQELIIEMKFVNVSLGSSLNMRNSASINSSIIVKLPRGSEVSVYEDSNGWAKVKAYGKMGYVSSEFLATTKPNAGTETEEDTIPDNNSGETENNDEQTISKFVNVMYGSSLNMRSEASTKASVLTKLSRSTVVTVHSEENDWARVTANGKTGYVSSQYLTTTEPFNPNTSIDESDKTSEHYDISLDDLTDIQMTVNPQTDKKYNTYIREDAIELTSSTSGRVKGSTWNVRGGAGPSHWVVGKVNGGANLQIISKTMGSDGYNWYQINYDKSWVNASPEDVKYYLNPTNHLDTTVDSLQFLKLSQPANLNAAEVNQRILSGKGILQGLASAFISAGETYNVNEIYLISHALLETGNGTSQLARGVQVNGKTVYNMYGIGAYDGTALASGAQYAYNAGWFTPEEAIIGGAKFIGQGYISAGQDTLYKMRWNPSSAVINGYASHQYATDIGWAKKQTNQIYNLYSLIDSYQLVLDVPSYKQ